MSESQSYHVVAKGLTSLGLIVAIGFGPLLAAEEFMERHWSSLATTAEPWLIPLFLGFAAGAGAMIVAGRLGQTRVNEWYVYFESYFETLRYPVNPDGEDDRSV